jgi:DNA-binding CsgD family transcriptional regulator
MISHMDADLETDVKTSRPMRTIIEVRAPVHDAEDASDWILPAIQDSSHDRRLVEDLRRDGCCGWRYLELRDRLWKYAMPVMKYNLRSGQIQRLCFERGVAVSLTLSDREALHTSIAERDALTVDTILLAEKYFQRKAITGGAWDPDKGASLETFFIGSCLMCFPRVYAKWSRERTDRLVAESYGLIPRDSSHVLSHRAEDPSMRAAQHDQIVRVLAMASPTARAIMAMIWNDHTYAEIGARLGLSERAVEGQMYRLRQKVKRVDDSRQTGSSQADMSDLGTVA